MAHFSVSPRVLGPLGAEQLQDPALAVLELVKNSWDADAKRVSILVEQTKRVARIAVMDDGHGMTRGEFEKGWLVIGASQKRSAKTSENGRPLIGEKGLGRLSSFALGSLVAITSARKGQAGFEANVNWEDLLAAQTLEDYTVQISQTKSRSGTRVEIQKLKTEWKDEQTAFLVTHAEFLASVPGEKFKINLRVNGKRHRVEDPIATTARLAEALMEMTVQSDGSPKITLCRVHGKDESKITFREMKEAERDPKLSGLKISLKFFRRAGVSKKLDRVLEGNEVKSVLERYQGVRFYRDGINVPPYGLNQDDWAGLEKGRTMTGGPTMVPGNSQLIGEVHISKRLHPHLVITAGRSGFSDQGVVRGVANYVRWAVRELGTARRAERLGINSPDIKIPARVDEDKKAESKNLEVAAQAAIARIAGLPTVRRDDELRKNVDEARTAFTAVLDKNQQMLRLYAQLASMGIAATSFAHELRTEFDVVSDGIDQLKSRRGGVDRSLIDAISGSWRRIQEFAALFKVVPVKLRRQIRVLSQRDLENSVRNVLGLAPSEKIASEIVVPKIAMAIVPAELDSILLNLVSNAVKAISASENRDAGKLRVKFSASADDITIQVADNGWGISPKVAEIMFEPLEGKFEEGTGMGLPITKYIAERYGGAVSVSQSPPSGYQTEFIVRLQGVAKQP